MGQFDYNSDAIPKVEAATQAIEEYSSLTMPKFLDTIDEIAQQSGSKKFSENANSLRAAVESFAKTLSEFSGEKGDKMDSGTLYGYITGANKLATILGE